MASIGEEPEAELWAHEQWRGSDSDLRALEVGDAGRTPNTTGTFGQRQRQPDSSHGPRRVGLHGCCWRGVTAGGLRCLHREKGPREGRSSRAKGGQDHGGN